MLNFSLITDNDGVRRSDDGAYIPADPRNRDWQEYLEWLALGNTPTPPEDSQSQPTEG